MIPRLASQYTMVAVRYRQRFGEPAPPLPMHPQDAVAVIAGMVARLNNRQPLTLRTGPGMPVEDAQERRAQAQEPKPCS